MRRCNAFNMVFKASSSVEFLKVVLMASLSHVSRMMSFQANLRAVTNMIMGPSRVIASGMRRRG